MVKNFIVIIASQIQFVRTLSNCFQTLLFFHSGSGSFSRLICLCALFLRFLYFPSSVRLLLGLGFFPIVLLVRR